MVLVGIYVYDPGNRSGDGYFPILPGLPWCLVLAVACNSPIKCSQGQLNWSAHVNREECGGEAVIPGGRHTDSTVVCFCPTAAPYTWRALMMGINPGPEGLP